MNTFESVKTDLVRVNRDFLSLFDTAKSIPGISTIPFDGWEKIGRTVEEQIEENILRVAVVGAIKSGKSTFVNALLGGDYLKRGAGVVTSIVTRIRKGTNLQANLIFKTWDDVNAEIEQAMIFLPSLDRDSAGGSFDVRQKKDRAELSETLNSLSAEQMISQDTRDVNVVLLSSYLKGYDRVAAILSDEGKTLRFQDADFARHKEFVGDDSLAVYLRDLEIRIPANRTLDDNIEIADCQGSDSPNPLHLAMIQDYLLRTHMIIYLLSSRTGVRQADIKFLSMIKKMGLMENIFFVVNCDFNEHETLEDLRPLIDRIGDDISIIKSDPAIFTFSTLFDLFKSLGENISEKDRMRMDQWEGETGLKTFSDGEKTRFETDLYEKLRRDRFSLLLKNHVERFTIMARGLRDWAKINSDILSKDADSAREILQGIRNEQEQMDRVKSLISDTLDGASQKTKRELEKDINGFLDVQYGDLFKEIKEFVRNYTIDVGNSEANLDGMGFSATMYMVFQEFKHALDVFMTETVNPRLVQFIRQDEKKIYELLHNVAGPYDTMVQDTVRRYGVTLQNLGIQLDGQAQDENISFDIERMKRMSGLAMPPLVSSLQYTTRIRAEAIMRLGFYNLVKLIKKIFKRPVHDEKESEMSALRDGVKRIKRETERSLIFHLGDYRENLKYQYIFKLVDVAATNLHDMLLDRFQVFSTDISEMTALVGQEHDVREDALKSLTEMDEVLLKISNQIVDIKRTMDF